MPDEPVFGNRKLNAQWSDLEQPIVIVTWEEAKTYCEWAKGRLPTEAEWEYAARATTTGPRYGELDAISWCADNSGNQRLDWAGAWEDAAGDSGKFWQILEENGNRIHPVKQKQPNTWGVYDMLGNVWEWVADWFEARYYGTLSPPAVDPKGPTSGTCRVVRGGAWLNHPWFLRVSGRNSAEPGDRGNHLGFRCVRELLSL
jgi:formylglycine-generating enzyme required for sulfatase activity